MFFERHGGGERAILVHLEGQDPEAREDPQEFQELAVSAGADTVAFFNVPRHRPSAKYLIGSGKVEELRDLVKAGSALEEDARSALEASAAAKSSVEQRINRVRENFHMQRPARIEDIAALQKKVEQLSRKVDKLARALAEQGLGEKPASRRRAAVAKVTGHKGTVKASRKKRAPGGGKKA